MPVVNQSAFLFYLNAEHKVADIVTAAGRGVGARDVLAVDVGHDGDMLTNGQVQEVLLMRQSELVPMGLHMRTKMIKNKDD